MTMILKRLTVILVPVAALVLCVCNASVQSGYASVPSTSLNAAVLQAIQTLDKDFRLAGIQLVHETRTVEAWWKAGGRYRLMSNGDVCSLGFPVRTGGNDYLLSANHCNPGHNHGLRAGNFATSPELAIASGIVGSTNLDYLRIAPSNGNVTPKAIFGAAGGVNARGIITAGFGDSLMNYPGSGVSPLVAGQPACFSIAMFTPLRTILETYNLSLIMG
jgi:hypothetical protein